MSGSGWIYGVISTALLAIVWKGKAYIGFRIGPIYFLEWLALVWGLVHLRWLAKNTRLVFRDLLPILAFFIWGMTLTFQDVWSHPDIFQKSFEFKRLIQHGILFAYPMIWALIGYHFAQKYPRWLPRLLWGAFAVSIYGHLSNLFQPHDKTARIAWIADFWQANISIGPIGDLPILIAPSWTLFSWGSLAFVSPFILSWESYLSRTYLLEFLLLLLLVPWISKKNFSQAALRSIVTIVIFSGSLGGYFYFTEHFFEKNTAPWMQRFQSGLRHSDDMHQEERNSIRSTPPSTTTSPISLSSSAPPQSHAPLIEARFRFFLWKTALEDWKENPVWGRGFLPEIPSLVHPGRSNVGSLEYPGSPPVAGPHNSYLTILSRMGIPGVLLFLWILWVWLREWKKISVFSETIRLFLFFIPVHGLVYASLNVGLESPHQCIWLWLMIGVGIGLSKSRPGFEFEPSPKTSRLTPAT